MDVIEWVVVEGQELTIEEEFDADLYQDRNYEIHTMPIELEYEDVYKELLTKGYIQ